jgi:DNA-binding NtrC family response regulator
MVTAAVRAGQLLPSRGIVISADKRLFTKIRLDLGSRGFRSVAHVQSVADYVDNESGDDPHFILVDLAAIAGNGGFDQFFSRAGKLNGGRIPLIQLGDTPWDRHWARLADRCIWGRWCRPFDPKELIALLGSFHSAGESCWQIAARRAWSIQAGPLLYECHTPAMHPMLDQLVMMATHDVTLLLVGETGTGKTTLARLVHELSPRRAEPFHSAACGAFAADQIEVELFGGSRIDAPQSERRRTGKFESAAGGSLLLDEIDVLSPALQTRLLHVIETGEFELAGTREIRSCLARLIVASNVDLKGLMEKSEFRADLYYRLNVLEFHLPPLRQRPCDIVPLTMGFVDEFRGSHGIVVERIHPEFIEVLKSYEWPGNIRELKNHIRRAVLFCRNGELSPADLSPNLIDAIRSRRIAEARDMRASSLFEQVATTEQGILQDALRAHGFKRTATALALGISRVGLYKKMKKYGLLGLPRKMGDAGRDAVPAPLQVPARRSPPPVVTPHHQEQADTASDVESGIRKLIR